MALPCKTPNVSTSRKRNADIDINDPGDIQKRVLQLRQLLNDVGVSPRNVDDLKTLQSSKAVEAQEAIWQGELGEIIRLKPRQRDAIGSLFASLFGIKVRGVVDPTLTLSTAGSVRNRMLEAGRVAENQLQLAAKVEYARRVGDVLEGLKPTFKRLGYSTNTQQELIDQAMRIGQIPRLRQTYGNTPGVEQVINNMYNDFAELTIGNGMKPEEIQQLVKAGEGVSSVFDEVRSIAAIHNIDLKNPAHLDLLPWSPTKDFQWRMNDLGIDKQLIHQLETGEKSLSDVWSQTIDLHNYMPHDDLIASKMLGISSDELRAKLANPTEWRNFLHNQVSAETLDSLVDTGVLSKLPMTGPQVFEYLTKQYELPYKGLNEMFNLDPKQAIDTYINNIRKQVYESSVFNDLSRNGLKGGWLVTDAQRLANPKEFEGFVPFNTLSKKHFSKLPEQTQEALKNAYVHPIVKSQIESLLDLASSPAQLGNAANVWNYLQPLFTKSVLLGSNLAYVSHVFMSNVVATMASGGHLLHSPGAFFDVFRSVKNLDHLDDTVKRFAFKGGEKLSEREMFKKLLLHRNVEVTPLVGGRIGESAKFQALNPKNIPGHIKYLWDYTNALGTPWSGERLRRAFKYEADNFMKQIDEAFMPMAAMTQQMELAFKWGAVKSMDMGKFKDFNGLLTHLDNYFYMYDDPGKLGSAINKYVQPFSSYLLQNTPSMVRFMLRSPQKFIAYNRLVALWNAEQIDPNNPPPDGGFRSSDMQKYPIVLRHDPNSKEYITLLPKNYDPVLDAFTFLTSSADTTQHLMFGHYTGNSEEQRKQAMGDRGWQKLLNDVFDGSYWSSPVQVLTGYDPYYGKVVEDSPGQVESFLGFRVNKLSKAFLSLIPPLVSLDQKNPLDVLGRKEIKDENGNVIVPGKQGLPEMLGLPGAAPRSSADSGKQVSRYGNAYEAMRWLGFNVKVVNTAINMQVNLSDIRTSIQDIRGQIVPAQKQLAVDLLNGKIKKDSPLYKQRAQEIDKAIDTWLQLEFDSRRIQLWMSQNNVKEKDVMRKLRDEQIAASMLPMPGASTVQKLLNEAKQLREQQQQQKGDK